jgi:hypothetical protein
MKSDEYDTIVEESPEVFAQVLGDLRDATLEACSQVLADTQEQEGGGKPKVRLRIAVVINLASSPPSWHLEGAVSVQHKVVSDVAVCDTHPKLPGFEQTQSKALLDKIDEHLEGKKRGPKGEAK